MSGAPRRDEKKVGDAPTGVTVGGRRVGSGGGRVANDGAPQGRRGGAVCSAVAPPRAALLGCLGRRPSVLQPWGQRRTPHGRKSNGRCRRGGVLRRARRRRRAGQTGGELLATGRGVGWGARRAAAAGGRRARPDPRRLQCRLNYEPRSRVVRRCTREGDLVGRCVGYTRRRSGRIRKHVLHGSRGRR